MRWLCPVTEGSQKFSSVVVVGDTLGVCLKINNNYLTAGIRGGGNVVAAHDERRAKT